MIVKMKSKILFSILGMILLIGSAIAGGVILSERTTSISETEKTVLSNANIKDVQVTELNCRTDYCTFWISKKDVINSERRIEKYKEVCTEQVIDIKPEDCEKENGVLDEKKVCRKTVCNQVAKTEIELVNERNSIVDSALSEIAKDIVVTKSPEVKVGTNEKVIISKSDIKA